MKSIIVSLLLMSCEIVYCQPPAGVNQPPAGAAPKKRTPGPAAKPSRIDDPPTNLSGTVKWRYLAVKEYMRYPSPLQVGDGVLAGMGDESAFFLFQILNARPALSADQTLTVLDIVHDSFKQPEAIQNGADLKPAKSLALLKALEKNAVDQRVKERIATETAFLKTVPEKIVAPPLVLTSPPKPGVMPDRADFPAAKP